MTHQRLCFNTKIFLLCQIEYIYNIYISLFLFIHDPAKVTLLCLLDTINRIQLVTILIENTDDVIMQQGHQHYGSLLR